MNLAALTRAKPPFFHMLTPAGCPIDLTRGWQRSMPAVTARVIRGRKSKRKKGLMNEIGAALQLPDFGENWDALYDVLCDDGLFPGPLIIVFSEADMVLESEPGTGIGQLAEVLRSAAETGVANLPPRPRHFILCESAEVAPSVLKRWQAAGAEFITPRRGRG